MIFLDASPLGPLQLNATLVVELIAFVVMACGDDPPVAGASTPREP